MNIRERRKQRQRDKMARQIGQIDRQRKEKERWHRGREKDEREVKDKLKFDAIMSDLNSKSCFYDPTRFQQQQNWKKLETTKKTLVTLSGATTLSICDTWRKL